MAHAPSVTIVVPCYNEARRLDAARFRSYVAAHRHVRFVLVNDGSTDGTLSLLESLAAHDPHALSVWHLPQNQGKAEAVRQGVLRAMDQGAQYVGYWDADLATPLEAIDDFVDVLDARDDLLVVVGARVRLLGRRIERRAVRHYLGRVFATCASLTLGLAIYDTQCGAKLVRVTDATRSVFATRFATGWIFDVEWLARLKNRLRVDGGRQIDEVVYELPLQAWRDVAGSKVRPRDFFKALYELTLIYRRYLRATPEVNTPAVAPSPAPQRRAA